MCSMNIWLLVVGIILLPIFLPIGVVLIFMALYGDFTKKYMKEVKEDIEEKKYSQAEYGTDILEKGI